MERRRFARRAPAGDEPIARVRLRTGRELLVIDASNAGALIEGTVRLLPGTHVEVHIVTGNGRVLVRSRIVRCYVAALDAQRVVYRGALAFDRHVDVSGHGLPVTTGLATGERDRNYPEATRLAGAA